MGIIDERTRGLKLTKQSPHSHDYSSGKFLTSFSFPASLRGFCDTVCLLLPLVFPVTTGSPLVLCSEYICEISTAPCLSSNKPLSLGWYKHFISLLNINQVWLSGKNIQEKNTNTASSSQEDMWLYLVCDNFHCSERKTHCVQYLLLLLLKEFFWV